MKIPFDIIIPNYNGVTLLEKYIPKVIEAVENSSSPGNIIVSDDASTDESVSFLRNTYPRVTVVSRKKNGGFIENCETGISRGNNQVFILLNNDVLVNKNFIDPLLENFKHPEIFSVTARSICPTPLVDRHDPSVKVNESICRAVWKDNMIDKFQPEIFFPEHLYSKTCTNFFASGGFSAFHRDKFEELGGFDYMFKPYYWEDVDLCFRAWKKGWVCLYEPRSIVYHETHGTINEEADARKRFLVETKHRLVFNWKHLDDPVRIYKHFIYICYLVTRKKRLNDFELFLRRAVFQALPLLPRILWKRILSSNDGKFNMDKIVQYSANNLFP